MQMDAKHTPGPWYADKVEDRDAYNIFPRGETFALLTVQAPAHDGAHKYGLAASANASLIAAAPDLLAALREARQELRFKNLTDDGGQRENTPISRVLATVDAAIAKAEGRA